MSFSSSPAKVYLTPINFGPASQPKKSLSGGLYNPNGSKVNNWINKSAQQLANSQNAMNKAIFLATKPEDAVKLFGTNLGKIKASAIDVANHFETLVDQLEKYGVELTDVQKDAFILRNAKKLVGEAQALYINGNIGAYNKLKKLGGIKGTVSKKARRIFKKRYGRRKH